MCGIAGIFNRGGEPVTAAELVAMARVQAHRGPDDEGLWTAGNIGFSHRRLSIIDLSDAAHQPMENEDGSVVMVTNGEIYNYIELMAELKEKGHVFRSRSDTEVMVHAYEEWGEDCVTRFNGMWAFALWDAREKKLLLSRDRFGIKPLYYTLDGDRLLFSSEIKALLEVLPSLREPNYPYLGHFLATSFQDDGEETFFKDVRQLLPARSMTVTAAGINIRRHWYYSREEARSKYDYSDTDGTFRFLLTDSVRLRMRSDVPVGTCLSGGLDSSTIVALASGMIDGKVKTFSSIYEEKEANEIRYVEAVVKKYRPEEYLIRPDQKELFDLLPLMIYHQDEPCSAPGLFSQWHVMKVAKGRVKVLLDGQGGDEILGGYFHFFPPYMATLAKEGLGFRPARLLKLAADARSIRELTGHNFALSTIFYFLPRKERERLKSKRMLSGTPLHPELIGAMKANPVKRPCPAKAGNDLDTALYSSIERDTLPALLHFEDRDSMAFSLEARTPFLDYRLVEFCLGLDCTDKIDGTVTKAILRRTMEGTVPQEVINRRDKMGFPTPVSRWFRNSPRAEEIIFSGPFLSRNLIEPGAARRAFEEHKKGERDHGLAIWRWINTELWFRRFIDR